MAKAFLNWWKSYTKSDRIRYLEESADHADLERRLKVLERHPSYYI